MMDVDDVDVLQANTQLQTTLAVNVGDGTKPVSIYTYMFIIFEIE